jgi:hypothetical protein
MKTPNLYFCVYLAALLMLTAVPTEAADVKELFAIDLADYPGKEGRMIDRRPRSRKASKRTRPRVACPLASTKLREGRAAAYRSTAAP